MYMQMKSLIKEDMSLSDSRMFTATTRGNEQKNSHGDLTKKPYKHFRICQGIPSVQLLSFSHPSKQCIPQAHWPTLKGISLFIRLIESRWWCYEAVGCNYLCSYIFSVVPGMILVLHNLLCSVIPKYNGAVNRDQKQKSWPQLFCPKEYINCAVTAKPYHLAWVRGMSRPP